MGLSLLLGAARGITSELLALGAWVAAFFAARAWGHLAATALAGWLPGVRELAVRQAIGFVAVFLATLLLFAALRFAVSRLLRAVGLGFADRLLGAVFGVLRGLLVVLLGVVVCGMSTLPMKSWWREALLAPPLETVVIAAKPWLPRPLAQAIRYSYR